MMISNGPHGHEFERAVVERQTQIRNTGKIQEVKKKGKEAEKNV